MDTMVGVGVSGGDATDDGIDVGGSGIHPSADVGFFIQGDLHLETTGHTPSFHAS